jgi:hypothetical protein
MMSIRAGILGYYGAESRLKAGDYKQGETPIETLGSKAAASEVLIISKGLIVTLLLTK